MRNALGLENLGPFFDNTKLIVAGLIFIPLKYLGFVWIKEDQKTINSVQLATPNVGSALFIFLTRVSGIVWAKRPADQLGSKQYIGFRQAPFKLHLRRLLFNEEFYRTRKQIADGTSQFKKHSVNVRALHVRCSSKGKQIALLTYIFVATVAVLLLVVIAFFRQLVWN